MAHLRVEPAGENPSTVCDCCGKQTKTVWGYIHKEDHPIAAYFVQWTTTAPTHNPNFDFLIGSWGNDAAESDRVLVSFSYRPARGGGSFMAIDGSQRPAAQSPLCRRPLSRQEVIGNSELMELSTGIIDAIWLGDSRLKEVQAFDADA